MLLHDVHRTIMQLLCDSCRTIWRRVRFYHVPCAKSPEMRLVRTQAVCVIATLRGSVIAADAGADVEQQQYDSASSPSRLRIKGEGIERRRAADKCRHVT